MKNITNSFNTNFSGTQFKNNQEEEKKPVTDEEKRVYMLKHCAEMLSSKAEMEVPENGLFRPKEISFLLNGTNNIAILEISSNIDNPKDQRDVNIGVRHKNSDKVYNNFAMFTGTKQEIINYLKDIDINLLDYIMNLSKLVDESCSSL